MPKSVICMHKCQNYKEIIEYSLYLQLTVACKHLAPRMASALFFVRTKGVDTLKNPQWGTSSSNYGSTIEWKAAKNDADGS